MTASRLRHGPHTSELPALAAELASWGGAYPARLPEGLAAPPASPDAARARAQESSARRAEGPLPGGRSELPREAIVNSQRERIVDATAAIVAEKGLAALTIPEIARRANVSNQTFYAIYTSKDAAFLGAQKVGMHQALRVTVAAYEDGGEQWPSAVRAGISALLEYLASEPDHAHLALVDTFAASPEALAIRERALEGFRAYLAPGVELRCRAARASDRSGRRHRGGRRRHLAGPAPLHREARDGVAAAGRAAADLLRAGAVPRRRARGGDGARSRLADVEYDLAERAALVERVKRLGGALEREALADRRAARRRRRSCA